MAADRDAMKAQRERAIFDEFVHAVGLQVVPNSVQSRPPRSLIFSSLIAASEKVCDLGSRKSPAIAIVRAHGASQAAENVGGKGGTRTLDPGIMSPVLGKSNL